MTALIIDGNHLAHRCRHAYNLSWQGQDTSVTYGFVRVLMSYLKQYQPEIVIVAWDSSAPLYRKQLIKAYKSNRHHDQDLTYQQFLTQLDELQRVLPLFGVVQAKRQGIEADDLAFHASCMLNNAIVISGDADLLQCVDDTTCVLKPGKTDTLITLDNFEQVVGVPRKHYEWFRALQGDSSDAIRGCAGLGPKTAQKIIAEVADPTNPDQLIAAAPKKLQPTLAEYITSGKYQAVIDVMYLAYDRVGARQTLLATTWQRFDKYQTMAWCNRWGFSSLVQAGSMAMFGRLHAPLWHAGHLRIPHVWSYYHAPLTE
jgi:DNA polymerase I